MAVASFRDLAVWQKSMELAELCHRLTLNFTPRDQFTLGYQIRKSAVSIPSNIAEGSGRYLTTSYVHYLRYALASSHELRTQLELAMRIGAMTGAEFERLAASLDEVGRMLNGLIRSLQAAETARTRSGR